MSSDDFKLVTYKYPKIPNKKLISLYYFQETGLNKETAIKRIEDAKKEILTSDLYDSVLASLREGFVQLNRPIIKQIICFGLGRISDCLIARYQFALLLCLKDFYKIEQVCCYDPLFTTVDCSILEHYNCKLFENNCEAKYRINSNDEYTTIFYLPHCAKQLINNLLWANWGLNLTKCVIIGNSFNTIIETTPKKLLEIDVPYVLKIIPYVLELAIINTFRIFQIFNDFAIHVFTLDRINLISEDFWQNCDEPVYANDTLQFIPNRQESQQQQEQHNQ